MARAIARELGVDLATIAGSGPGGRVVKADLERAAAAPPAAAPSPPLAATAVASPTAAPGQTAAPSPEATTDGERIPLTAMRKTVARRLVESAQSAPHFYLTTIVDADRMLALRGELNDRLAAAGGEFKVSVNDLIVKACANTLRTHPEVNVSWQGDAILWHHRIHIGIAVAVDGGLIVPVVRDADQKSLTAISNDAKKLIARARVNKLTPADYTGGTFSVTNLGMYGIDQFTAVINPPEAAILAVGTTSPELVMRDGQVATRQVLKLTLAIDHRALDGATGAGFLQHLKALLEDPLRIVA
jgi:pyruvate dehydrogenase E2 component (dihydrolipoamide acetyltransferase)